ncbi:MAG: LPS export ABC transporter periplasmic protein LptC [Beijerinckiaceae bacterium]|jgi:lipopolysaccharide export system protein LptC|nr:LPS export ABC transporter periplasmic protein LptC [Beijerinckiaceae bacterium]
MNQIVLSAGHDYRVRVRSHEEQAAAYKQARVHSGHVRWLKRLIIAGTVCFVILGIGYSVFDPFRKLPKDVSIARASLNGTKITMEHPKLSGFRKDGRPYQLVARSGIQDIREPKIIDLREIDATIRISDADTVRINAPAGRFDSGGDLMQLTTKGSDSKIRFRGSTYSITLDSADVNFKTGVVISREPVSVVFSNGTIKANGLNVLDNGKRIVFLGDVRSVLNAPPAAGDKQQDVAVPGAAVQPVATEKGQ